jgi:hypothetical protein
MEPIAELVSYIDQINQKIIKIKEYTHDISKHSGHLENILQDDRLGEFDYKIANTFDLIYNREHPDLSNIFELYNQLIQYLKHYLESGPANTYKFKDISKDLEAKYVGLLLSTILNLNIIFRYYLPYTLYQKIYREIKLGNYANSSELPGGDDNTINNDFIDRILDPSSVLRINYEIKIDSKNLVFNILRYNSSASNNEFIIEISNKYNLYFRLVKDKSKTIPVKQYTDCASDIDYFDETKESNQFSFRLDFSIMNKSPQESFISTSTQSIITQPTRETDILFRMGTRNNLFNYKNSIKFTLKYYSCTYSALYGLVQAQTFTRRQFIIQWNDKITKLSFTDAQIDRIETLL